MRADHEGLQESEAPEIYVKRFKNQEVIHERTGMVLIWAVSFHSRECPAHLGWKPGLAILTTPRPEGTESRRASRLCGRVGECTVDVSHRRLVRR